MTSERKNRISTVLQYRQPDVTVVLENITDPHNISAIMRTCDAIGVKEIFVLNTKIPKHKKFGQTSSSSALKWILLHQYTDAATCFAELRQKYDIVLSTYLDDQKRDLYNIDFTNKIALVFGNETEGVSAEIREYTDGNFIIPQVGMIQSLNVSVACAVCLYEAFRQKKRAGHYVASKLSAIERQELMNHWNIVGQID